MLYLYRLISGVCFILPMALAFQPGRRVQGAASRQVARTQLAPARAGAQEAGAGLYGTAGYAICIYLYIVLCSRKYIALPW